MSGAVHLDRAIAQRILGGDEAAFQDLFDRFFPRLYRYALARLDHDAETARDIVQTTFCRAIERLDGYRGEAALYTWFCQICRNAIADHYRRRQRGQPVLLEDQPNLRAVIEAMTAPASDSPEQAAWRSEVRRLVEAVVDALPGHYGDALEWKYVEGLTVREIAARLDLTDKAAESLLGRARESFRAAFTELAGAGELLSPPATGGRSEA